MKPTIGRIVLYRLSGLLDIPAIITGVDDERTVSLTAFPVHGAPLNRKRVALAEEDDIAKGTWRWPERVG